MLATIERVLFDDVRDAERRLMAIRCACDLTILTVAIFDIPEVIEKAPNSLTIVTGIGYLLLTIVWAALNFVLLWRTDYDPSLSRAIPCLAICQDKFMKCPGANWISAVQNVCWHWYLFAFYDFRLPNQLLCELVSICFNFNTNMSFIITAAGMLHLWAFRLGMCMCAYKLGVAAAKKYTGLDDEAEICNSSFLALRCAVALCTLMLVITDLSLVVIYEQTATPRQVKVAYVWLALLFSFAGLNFMLTWRDSYSQRVSKVLPFLQRWGTKIKTALRFLRLLVLQDIFWFLALNCYVFLRLFVSPLRDAFPIGFPSNSNQWYIWFALLWVNLFGYIYFVGYWLCIFAAKMPGLSSDVKKNQ
eukprot:gnl/TRDRNA2_/TRDRNA2_31761_c0_seq1.p1 gnl/TRDRNA2_/TRDRNA2_31761_c0~~gnl/TRDRNA2_/TRDRNA2_31761_c0_seq1.p1  ORF type:complete len:360 (-),score=51.66 gnl/TRDRNA2_/TRDRNA2_31761_c0_seq1:11-1090(-)